MVEAVLSDSPLARLDLLRQRIVRWHERILAPGSGRVVRMSGPTIDPFSSEIVVAGQSFDSLDQPGSFRLHRVDRSTGRLIPICNVPGDQVDPRFSPRGGQLVFRQTRQGANRQEACLFDFATSEIQTLYGFEGSIEFAGWLPDASSIVLLAADAGVSLASVQGATVTEKARGAKPTWFPHIDDATNLPRRRLLLASPQGTVSKVESEANVWEACAAGNSAIAVIATDDPAEDDWYRADLRLISLRGTPDRVLYVPQRQLAGVSSNDEGTQVAIIEGLASDRGSLAGDLLLVDVETGAVRHIDTHGVDVTWTGWQGNKLVAAGIRSDDMVVLLIDKATGAAEIFSEMPGVNGGQRYPWLALLPAEAPRSVAVLLDVGNAERLAIVDNTPPEILVSLSTGDIERAIVDYGADRFRPVRWTASDGLEIEGWLHTPAGRGPFPLAMLIHGGPVMRWVPKSIIEFSLQASLAAEGFAQFMPNPRGSTGRGQSYAQAILRDMGGRDARDLLEGIDMLVAQGIADPDRLFVTGISHGGFMSSWLVTQDRRFKAAAAVSPITDWTSQRLTSDIPTFNKDFVGDPLDPLPSPVLYADGVTTKMLMIAGAKDRCTPPSQAEEFHKAVRLAGGASTLVLYPEEGHGIRSNMAASADHIARIIAFFEESIDPDARDLAAQSRGCGPDQQLPLAEASE